MTKIKRICSNTPNVGVLIETDKGTGEVNKTELSGFNNSTELKVELKSQTGELLGDVFIHKNRDGSYAIAIGQEPDVWPEDEVLDQELQ